MIDSKPDLPFRIGSFAVGLVTSLWLSLSLSVQILVILMAIDMITGMVLASRNGRLSSAVGSAGVAKKASVLIVLIVTYLLQYLAEEQVAPGFRLPIHLGAAVALAYVIIEAVSIIENCHELGAPIPPMLSEALRKAGQLTEIESEVVLESKVILKSVPVHRDPEV